MHQIVFLGSKPLGYQCLQHVLQQQTALQAQVIAVGTNPKATLNTATHNIADLCHAHGLPMLQGLHDLPPCDFIVSVQYHRILRQPHIDQARRLAVNLHTAPLPEYRGCHPFSFAIIDQATEYGTTLHQLTAGIDSGDILFERRFPIAPHTMVGQLFEQTQHESLAMFAAALPHLLSGNYTRLAQSSRATSHPSSYHYRHEMDEIKKIDLNWSAERIERHLRATYFPPFAPPYAMVGKQKVFFSFDDVGGD